MASDADHVGLPRGWCHASIDAVVGRGGLFRDGDWIESEDQDPRGEVRLIQLADIGDGVFTDKSSRFLTLKRALELNCTFLRQDDILLARMPHPLGRACIFPLVGEHKYVTAVDVCIIRVGEGAVAPRFLVYLINSPVSRKAIDGHKSGSTRERISRKNIAKIQFPIAPLREQLRVVDKIDELISELDKGIQSLETARGQLKVYRQAVLREAFEGKLTANWRMTHTSELESAEALLRNVTSERVRRYEQQLGVWRKAASVWESGGQKGRRPTKPTRPRAVSPLTRETVAELPGLPEGWVYVQAESVSDFITKGTTPGATELLSESGDVPFIKVYNLTDDGRLDFSVNPTFVSKNTHFGSLARSRVLPGDVLMNIVGPPLGKVSLVTDVFPEWNINQAIVRYRTLSSLSNRYLLYFLLAGHTVRRMSKRSKATAGQFNLTLEICRDVEVPLCAVAEQVQVVHEIESRLLVVGQLERTMDEALTKAEALRQSILKKAFEGKLVPQDPKDEPAAVLLDRVKAEKAKPQGNPGKRKK